MSSIHQLNMTRIKPSFLKARKLSLIAISALGLAACGAYDGDSKSEQNTSHTNNYTQVEGQAIKGVISDGIITAFSLSDLNTPLATTRTDANGDFSFDTETEASLVDYESLYLVLSVDSDTRMRCDVVDGCYESISGATINFGENLRLPAYFKLSGVSLNNENSSNTSQSNPNRSAAHISPLSHIIVSTALSFIDNADERSSLSIENIESANDWIQEAFDLDYDPLTVRTIDLTDNNEIEEANLTELTQGVYAAALYDEALSSEWANTQLDVGELDLADIAQRAASQADKLAEQLSESGDTNASVGLQSVSQNSSQLANNLSARDLTIHSQPQSVTTEEGNSVSLFVLASSENQISYQWFKDGDAISGATSSSFNIASSQISDSGIFHVEVSDSQETLSSLFALVSIQAKPQPATITEQPTNLILNEGDAIVLSVNAEGEAPLNYQWQKDGSMIPGATNSTLSIDNSQTSDSGTYRVTVTNSVNSVDSSFVTVTVNEQVYPPSILQQPQSLTVTEDSSATLSVIATGTGYLSYQWRKDGATVAGEYSNTLTFASVGLDDAGTYEVYVSNSQGSLLSMSAELNVLPNIVPVSITQHPIAQDLYVGQSFSLSISTTGDEPITYQWYKDGAAILGATSRIYTVQNATYSDIGAYEVIVQNEANAESSRTVNVDVVSVPPILLSWDTPLLRSDDSDLPLIEIEGYVIEYGYSLSNLDQRITIENPNLTQYLLSDLQPGTLYARIATLDFLLQQSEFSAPIVISID